MHRTKTSDSDARAASLHAVRACRTRVVVDTERMCAHGKILTVINARMPVTWNWISTDGMG